MKTTPKSVVFFSFRGLGPEKRRGSSSIYHHTQGNKQTYTRQQLQSECMAKKGQESTATNSEYTSNQATGWLRERVAGKVEKQRGGCSPRNTWRDAWTCCPAVRWRWAPRPASAAAAHQKPQRCRCWAGGWCTLWSCRCWQCYALFASQWLLLVRPGLHITPPDSYLFTIFYIFYIISGFLNVYMYLKKWIICWPVHPKSSIHHHLPTHAPICSCTHLLLARS